MSVRVCACVCDYERVCVCECVRACVTMSVRVCETVCVYVCVMDRLLTRNFVMQDEYNQSCYNFVLSAPT